MGLTVLLVALLLKQELLGLMTDECEDRRVSHSEVQGRGEARGSLEGGHVGSGASISSPTPSLGERRSNQRLGALTFWTDGSTYGFPFPSRYVSDRRSSQSVLIAGWGELEGRT